MSSLEELKQTAVDIFLHALGACDISKALDRHLHFDGMTLVRSAARVSVPLDAYKDVLVVALGKAALPMLDALLARLPKNIPVRGVCSAPRAPAGRQRHIQYFEGGHPLPNKDSFAAAQAALDLLQQARRDTFIFFLISGGGSSMFELPIDASISLDDTIAFHEALIGSGTTIAEINTVRKYFSAVKGGRLALAAPVAEKLTLLLADVPLKDVAAVASSPTLPDQSTAAQCAEILGRCQLVNKFPASVREYFRTISSPPAAVSHAQFEILLSENDFVSAAGDRAAALGFHVVIDDTCDDWDYAAASRYLLTRFHKLRAEFPRLCLLSGGEVTVKLNEHPGQGGRNQHFALASAFELANHKGQTLAILSAGSDGIDGNSPVAGAIADTTTISRAHSLRLDPVGTLERFDSYSLFSALGDNIVTGPTGNNLRDLRILIARSE